MLCLLLHGLLSLHITGRNNTTTLPFPRQEPCLRGAFWFARLEQGTKDQPLITGHLSCLWDLIECTRLDIVDIAMVKNTWQEARWDPLAFSSHIDTPNDVNLLDSAQGLLWSFHPWPEEAATRGSTSPLTYVRYKAWVLTALPCSSFTC